MKKTYQLDDLLNVMRRLRDPDNGCPWDLEQTPKSLVKYTLEECYELVDAIESDDAEHVCEELGDLLLQIVFYCQFAEEQGDYSFSNVVNVLTEKLIRRHPHVFTQNELYTHTEEVQQLSADEVVQNWDAIKQQERSNKEQQGMFDNVPLAFPSLLRAQKIQKRASKVGFDFETVTETIDQLKLEIAELESALQQQDADGVIDEMGDVLFSCVNISRHLKLSAEDTLRASTTKFVRRMTDIENLLQNKAIDWKELTEKDRDSYWSLVK